MSQHFVLEVTNIGKRATRKDIVKFLDDIQVAYKSCRKSTPTSPAFVTFNTEDEMKEAVKYLSARMNKSGDLLVVKQVDGEEHAKRGDDIADVVTPLWETTYNDQLIHKQREIVHAMRRLVRNLRRSELREGEGKTGLYPWLQVQRGFLEKSQRDAESQGGNADAPQEEEDVPTEWVDGVMPQGGKFVDVLHGLVPGVGFQVDQILRAPHTSGYRNKCQFTFGYDAQGKPSLGFRLGSFKGVGTMVASPDACLNVTQPMKFMCNKVAEFVREVSEEFPIYSLEKRCGFWRRFTMRSSEATGQHLGVVTVDAEGFELEKVNQVVKQLADSLSTPCDSWPKDMPLLTGFVLQRCSAVSIPNEGLEAELVSGKPTIVDELLGLKFNISSESFFQVNTKAAEVLYSKVGEFLLDGKTKSEENQKPIVFDVCCGTGTIGLTLANQASHIVGIELSKPAVVDARANAELNGITNANFVAARAEHVMHAALPIRSRYSNTTIGRIVSAKAKMCDDTEREELDKLVDVVDVLLHGPEGSYKVVSKEQAKRDAAVSGADETTPAVTGDGNVDVTNESNPTPVAEAREAGCSTNTDESTNQSTASGTKEVKPVTETAAQGSNSVVQAVSEEQPQKECLVVVDPPRPGLHKTVLQLLRNHPGIQRIVYVSCNPTGSFVEDCTMLCSTKRFKGLPFRVVRVCPVDMFPHTEHIELVALLERCDEPPPPRSERDIDHWQGAGQKSKGSKNKNKRERKAKRPCRMFFQSGTCKFGDKCKFSHESDEVRAAKAAKVEVENNSNAEPADK